MTYLPKSKISILEATGGESGDEFITKNSNKPYVGPYIETSDGKYFAGNSTINRGEEIYKSEIIALNFGKGNDFNTYQKIKIPPYKHLSKTKPIPSSKTKPTEKDYIKNYVTRYFVSRVNQQFGYKEISSKTYKSINKKEGKYDHILYNTGLINWAIKGNVYQSNSLQLQKLERTFPNISHLFTVLNEFQRSDLQVQTHLTTEGDELYFPDGREYVGLYHIHPTQGPMVGAIHQQSSHPKLYYADQIPSNDSTLDDDFKKYQNKRKKKSSANVRKTLKSGNKGIKAVSTRKLSTPTQTTSNIRSTPSRGNTSTPSSTSGGGGGGY